MEDLEEKRLGAAFERAQEDYNERVAREERQSTMEADIVKFAIDLTVVTADVAVLKAELELMKAEQQKLLLLVGPKYNCHYIRDAGKFRPAVYGGDLGEAVGLGSRKCGCRSLRLI